jgi:hypothetical protein
MRKENDFYFVSLNSSAFEEAQQREQLAGHEIWFIACPRRQKR